MNTQTKECSTCGDLFASTKTANGRWQRTCSVACRIEAMRRFARALLARADAIEDEIVED